MNYLNSQFTSTWDCRIFFFFVSQSIYNTPYKNITCIDDLPDSWAWVRLEGVAQTVTNKSNQILTKDILEEGLFPVISQGKSDIDGYCNNIDKIYKVETPSSLYFSFNLSQNLFRLFELML